MTTRRTSLSAALLMGLFASLAFGGSAEEAWNALVTPPKYRKLPGMICDPNRSFTPET